jgi:SAM-dependent methyltransferase
LIQRNPLLRVIVSLIERGLGRQLYTRFPSEVYRWDVTRGLPWKDETVEVIYASHFLDHLPRQQAEDFLREAYRVLIPGGILRLALSDLERKARQYLDEVHQARLGASSWEKGLPADNFLRSTLLGVEVRPSLTRPISFLRALLFRGGHLWMWDAPSLILLLRHIGFREVRECAFRESIIQEVSLLDLESRKDESFYVEAVK